ncbi:unnamed protein product [Rhizoctonia solani]|uniref:Uncharacterized protein n=1 Tax=Rhizoctonia solani TaxID=456999 RepID=A0A8H3E6H9_9AGAM|nr:unnamed protein product [Rhizoctonia solani]
MGILQIGRGWLRVGVLQMKRLVNAGTGASSNHPSSSQASVRTTGIIFQIAEGPTLTFRKLACLYLQSPRHTFDPKILLTSPSFDEYLLAQHDRLVDRWDFKPTHIHKHIFRANLLDILQRSISGFSRWIALINYGICEAFILGDPSQNRLHSLWMECIGNTLKRELSAGSHSLEVQSCRRDWIYVSLMRSLVIHSSDVYRVLKSVTPAFLELAFSNPALWPSGSNLAYIPLANVLTIESSHELVYFTLIDCTYSMAFGVPQLVEYDTTVYPSPGSSSHQWAHGCPAEFQVALTEINACRDSSPSARGWNEIERWLIGWQSRFGEYMFTESWMTIGWYAVQESWRLALLVYLYLAVCDIPSDDPRIQVHVKQLLQVLGTIKKRGTEGNVPFFIHYLIVGICARSEAHRQAVRQKLSVPKETRIWLTRASDFVPVLDHLWHGAGAHGHPVRWSDYMRSREAVLPITV